MSTQSFTLGSAMGKSGGAFSRLSEWDYDGLGYFTGIVVSLCYFAGLHYLNEYFRFFAIHFLTLSISFENTAWMAFNVIYVAITSAFTLPSIFTIFLVGVIVACVIMFVPQLRLPLGVRLVSVFVILLVTFFHVAGSIGQAHACSVFHGAGKAVTFIGLELPGATTATPQELASRDRLLEANFGAQLMKVWETTDFVSVVMSDATVDCYARDLSMRPKVFEIHKDSYSYYVSVNVR